jgi:hypothetical protein
MATSKKLKAAGSRKKTADKAPAANAAPSAPALAKELGVTLTKPVTPRQIASYRKGLPGYAGLLDNVADLLEAETDFSVKGVTPKDLLDTQAERAFLATREAVLYRVYRSVYEQRLAIDDRGMKMIEKLARKVEEASDDDGELVDRWSLLTDFLKTFRKGGKKAEAPAPLPDPPPDDGAITTTAKRTR